MSLDGAAGDGEVGENDNVAADVENVSGGSADDVLTRIPLLRRIGSNFELIAQKG